MAAPSGGGAMAAAEPSLDWNPQSIVSIPTPLRRPFLICAPAVTVKPLCVISALLQCLLPLHIQRAHC